MTQTPATPELPPLVGHTEKAMGTVFSFSLVPGGLPQQVWRNAVTAACLLLHETDMHYSTWDGASPLSRYRRGEVTAAQMPGDFAEVRAECEAAIQASGGWFDPWAMPGGFDPTGLVKGWAVERALAVLRDAGVPAALVNGGGDVATYGCLPSGHPWRVGIQHPWRPHALACVIETTACVATSGSYERGPHLIDPRTSRPATMAASATVTGPHLALADALATALAVAGDQVLPLICAVPGYEAYLIRPDGTETDTGGITFAA
ncbi:MAG TPA: FAD:protein FMN transferase [Streptosporangiaceae bacterium]|nr:FAD:protein FMN transferase [Streptosporangiaceae bacterium]